MSASGRWALPARRGANRYHAPAPVACICIVGAPARAHRKGCESPTYSVDSPPTKQCSSARSRRSRRAPRPPAPRHSSSPCPPAAAPPSPPRPLIPPGASPAIVVCGGEGGALTGGAVLVRCSWAGGRGALWSLWSLLVEPTQPAATCRPGATGRTDCRAPSSRPHSPSAGRATRPIRTVQRVARGDRRKPKLTTPPLAARWVLRGRLPRSPLIRYASPRRTSTAAPLVAPQAAPSVRVCAPGGAAQAPQGAQPRHNPRKEIKNMKTAPIYGPDRHLIRRKADCAGQLITVADFAAEAGISRPRAYQLLSFCPRYRVTDPDTGARMVMVSIRDARTALYYRGRQGNPLMTNSDFQRRMAWRRWHGKKSAQEG